MLNVLISVLGVNIMLLYIDVQMDSMVRQPHVLPLAYNLHDML